MRTSLKEWEDFRKSTIWAELLEDIQERDAGILARLRVGGDEKWSDENMRGRLSELEYIAGLVDFIILDLKAAEKAEKENKNG